MDWVKVYCIVIITIGFIVPMTKNGQPKPESVCGYDWYDGFVEALVMLPLYGRILGFW